MRQEDTIAAPRHRTVSMASKWMSVVKLPKIGFNCFNHCELNEEGIHELRADCLVSGKHEVRIVEVLTAANPVHQVIFQR